MTADEILFEAVQLEPERRHDFVVDACAGDRPLLMEVESLLRAHELEAGFLEDRPLSLAVVDFVGAGGSMVGEELRGYRVLRLIGRGGMGEIYLAERADEEFRKSAAVKTLRPGLDSEEFLARFLRERQLLADLDHPNIARLLDGGTTASGRPYLVMEFVEGRPIDVYCREEGVPLKERLELFRTVCGAAHYAHRNLIVHRDLKPSNLLVDGEGTVKLLDFGIAKLLDAEDGGATVAATAIGSRPMTPRYAAPEQILEQRLTTATDVYALGAILFELLAGRTPFDAPGITRSELERRICEQDPPRPSAAVLHAAAEAQWPRIDRRALSRRLANDLDNIVGMAMAKDPDRRYGSAEQLAADISHYLANRPVQARQDTLSYRVGKFTRRHARGVAVAAGAVAALVVATVVSARLYVGAEAARRDAELQERTATEVSGFLEDMLASVDPVASQSREEITVRDFLDEAALHVKSELDGQPQVAAKLLTTIGSAYSNLALYDEARASLSEALELRTKQPTRDASGVAGALLELGRLHGAAGDLEAANLALSEALRVSSETLEPALWTSRARLGLALLRKTEGNYEEAEELFRRALADFRRLQAEEVTDALRELGLLLSDRGRYDEAEALMAESLSLLRERLGEEHSSVAQVMNDLGWVLRSAQRSEEALPFFERALEIYTTVYPSRHPKLAVARANLAGQLRDQGRFDEARLQLEESLEAFREALGPDHPYVGHTLNNLGLVLELSGDGDAAISRFREAAQLYRRELGDHPFVGAAQFNLARALCGVGDVASAEREARANLELRRRVLRSGHPDTARPLALLGRLRLDQDDAIGALPLIEESLTIRVAALGESHELTSWSRALRGMARAALGESEAARADLRAAVEALSAALGDDHRETRQARAALGELEAGRSGRD